MGLLMRFHWRFILVQKFWLPSYASGRTFFISFSNYQWKCMYMSFVNFNQSKQRNWSTNEISLKIYASTYILTAFQAKCIRKNFINYPSIFEIISWFILTSKYDLKICFHFFFLISFASSLQIQLKSDYQNLSNMLELTDLFFLMKYATTCWNGLRFSKCMGWNKWYCKKWCLCLWFKQWNRKGIHRYWI